MRERATRPLTLMSLTELVAAFCNELDRGGTKTEASVADDMDGGEQCDGSRVADTAAHASLANRGLWAVVQLGGWQYLRLALTAGFFFPFPI